MENEKDALSALNNSDLFFLMGDNPVKTFGESADLAVPCSVKASQAGTSIPAHTDPPPSSTNEPAPETSAEATDKDRKNEQREGEEEEEEEEEGGEGRVAEGGWAEERVGQMSLFGVPIVSLFVEGQERLCLAQISASLLHDFSYNEIHNRRVALGITCLQCTPAQLEVLRRAGAMPVTSRRCGLITKREAERLVRSFIADVPPPRLPDNFVFRVRHQCGWGNEGIFVPVRYNSSRAKCIKCSLCDVYFSPNKFIFHCHPTPTATYRHPDAANFNSWRRHLELVHDGTDERLIHAWEDVKAMFNGGSRKRISISSSSFSASSSFVPPARTNLSVDNYLQRSQSEAGTGLHGSHDANRQGMGNRNSNNNNIREVQNWAKLSMEKNLTPSAMSFPPPSSSLSLMPPPALGAGTAHPAFFPTGLHPPMPPMSYGEFLRSMSRPYNVSNLPLPGNTLLSEMYRPSPTSNLGMFGTSSYPLSYLGYPPYLPSDSVSPQIKGGNAAYFTPQLPDLREFGSDSNSVKAEDKEIYDVMGNNIKIPEQFKFMEDTQDEIIVDEEEEDNKEKRNEELKPSIEETEEERRIVTSLNEGDSLNSPEPSKKTSENEEKDSKKIGDRDLMEERTAAGDRDCKTSGTDSENSQRNDDEEEAQKLIEEQKAKASCLPPDTKSLLAIFEATEDVSTFVHLPIETLRLLYRASKKKSRATDQELKKVKEIQRLQRARAEELREQLSRQFFALKETIWTEIEKERKMRTALQDRLAETQKLTSQNYTMFSRMK